MAILITGANGQIGTILARELRQKYGTQEVITSDITEPSQSEGPFVMLDILNTQRIREIVADFKIDEIYHLAAILSASGEWNPKKTWNVNFNGFLSLLEITHEMRVKKLFFPSTIAVFGPTTPKVKTPQFVSMMPTTVYGISKLAGENWCQYYHHTFGVDVRSLRYPGIISHDTLPGGGTTDYAVEIFHAAVNEGAYTCFLGPKTRLPMIYMDDAIKATMMLMEAPADHLTIRSGYNVASMSFTPEELADAIRRHLPNFKIFYQPDFRQEIADSWSESIDDHRARQDWDWQPQYDLWKMTEDMLHHLGAHTKT